MASSNRSRTGKKSYTFTMTTPDMVWTCVGAVFALTVFFLFGVLVGRGYLPTDVEQPAEVHVAESTHGQLSAGDGGGEEAAESEIQAEPEVLKPEELAYQDQLDKPADQVEQVVEEAVADGEQEAENAAGEAEAVVEEADEKVEKAADGMYDGENLPAPEPGEKVYHYTYQAAAFKDQAAADSLAGKLKNRAIPAKVVKGVTTSATWYRVQIPFTGTPTQTRPLRDAVKSVTGQKPVMVSKKQK